MNVRVWLMIGVLIFGVRFGLPVAYDVPPKVSSLYRLSLLASIVLFLSICCIAINVINLLPVFNLILPNVLTLFHLASFGTFCFTTVAMSTLSLFYNISMLICLVVFDMRVVSAPSGKPPMVYYKETLLVWLS